METRGSLTIYRHYVFAGGQAVAQYERRSSGSPANDIQYLHRDHQASVVATTNAAGSVRQRWEYDAFGWRTRSAGSGADDTERGYTGHEHLDAVELTHMNGRVQDPERGRFISADPFVQAPYRSQSLNRYSYVWNNPLTLVDPSGFRSEDPYQNPANRRFWDPESCKRNDDGGWYCVFCAAWVDLVPTEDPTGLVFANDPSAAPGSAPLLSGLSSVRTQVGEFILPTITAFGQQGVSGSIADNGIGATKYLYNTAVDVAEMANPGAALARMLGIGTPKTAIADNQLGGAAFAEGVTVVAGAIGAVRSVAAKGATELHHLLPQAQRFRKFFERAGLNVEDFKIPLDTATHRLKPGGIHTKAGGDWNGVWDDFFEANPSATRDQILQQLERMRGDFGI